jgi:SAM-dependent methyltransferase
MCEQSNQIPSKNFKAVLKDSENDIKKFSKSNSLLYNEAMTLLNRIALPQKAIILDIGCGDGMITCEIAKKGYGGFVMGTDKSPKIIKRASKNHNHQQNLFFLQMDACKNIFKKKFDMITSFNCLHWVKQPQNALYGIANAAVSNARIILIFSHKKSLFHQVLDKLSSSLKWRNYFLDFVNPRAFFEIHIVEEMLIKADFKVIEMQEKENTYFFNSVIRLREFFTTTGSHIKQIPNQLVDNFVDDCVSEFIKAVNIDDRISIPVSFWNLQIIASNKSC